MLDDEIKYKKLRESLRSLPKIKAKGDFEARLFRKIKEHESHSRLHTAPEMGKKSSIIDVLANLLRPSLVPAIGLTVVLLITVVVYFAYFNELKKDTQQTVVSGKDEKNGEFVIYVHKDGERVSDETARDITSNDLRQPETMISPTERSTDAFSQPVESPKTESEIKDKEDRLSKEQEFKMEKESEQPAKDFDETKVAPKLEERKIMKKGFEDDIKKAPSNERKEDTSGKDEGNMQNQTITPQNEGVDQKEMEEQKTDDKRISRGKQDSLKAKNKKVEEQKDSMEK